MDAKLENGLLFIPFKNADKAGDLAVRIYTSNGGHHYASTRLGQVEANKEGLSTVGVQSFDGCKFDVRLTGNSKPIIEGIIGVQKAEAKKSKEGKEDNK